MTQRTLAVLVVLNAILLAAIALTLSSPQPAQAQIGGGSYLMIAGSNAAVPQQQVIYILNQSNGKLGAILVNDANGRIDPIGARELSQDIQNAGPGRGGR
ncbi:MAG: hypothetical protein AAGC44_13550 [Planctomycetota bacterium]